MERRLLRCGEYALAADFINTHWKEDHIYARDSKLFDWSFGRRPGWDNDDEYSFFVAVDDGAIVSILGFQPYFLNVFGKTHLATWLSNWKTIAGYTGGPVGLQLLFAVKQLGYYALVSLGISEFTVRTYAALKGEVIEGMPRWMAVLPGQAERFGHLLSLANSSMKSDQIRGLTERLRIELAPALHSKSVTRGWIDAAIWDREFWPIFAPSMIGGVRDSTYMAWRYLHHPSFDYRLLTINEGQKVGFAIWRVEMIHRQTKNGLEPVYLIGRCLEFFASDQDTAELLLAALLNDASQEDAIAVDWYGHYGPTGRMLTQSGMVLTNTLKNGADIPSRFQPLDASISELRGAVLLPESAPMYPFSVDCSWYTTRSDSDQDRPN